MKDCPFKEELKLYLKESVRRIAEKINRMRNF